MARSLPQSATRYPFDSIFGVDSHVRILRALSRHGGLLSAADIGRRAGLSKSSVRLGLIGLSETGLVDVEGSGHARLYRLDGQHVLSGPITRLFDAEDARFAAILAAIRDSAGPQAPMARAIWLYGSAARGEDRTGSDLDIVVIAAGQQLAAVTDAMRNRLAGPSRQLGFSPSLVGISLDDAARLAGQSDPWWSNVVNDAIVISGDRPDRFGQDDMAAVANG